MDVVILYMFMAQNVMLLVYSVIHTKMQCFPSPGLQLLR